VSLELLTLNVGRPPRDRAEGLLAYLWSRPERVLVLTEVGTGGGSGLIAAVAKAAGYTVAGLGPNLRDLGVTIIGREIELSADTVPRPGVLPGRVETVVAHTASGPVRIAGVYGAASDPVRYASGTQRQRKRAWLVAFDAWLDGWLRDDGTPQVLIGDLNIADPIHTSPLRCVLTEELQSYVGLSADHGLTDAWRHAHPEAAAVSWVDHSGAGCRYDHAFVTPDLVDAVASCELDDTPRLDGLTDHSALSLALRTP
jgi:exodeoxyribonuclease III